MKQQEFEAVLNKRVQKMLKTLDVKRQEYMQEDDRLYNFKVGARVRNKRADAFLMDLMTKHLICVMDMCDGLMEITEERIEEHLGDCIVYLLLLEALWREQLDRGGTSK